MMRAAQRAKFSWQWASGYALSYSIIQVLMLKLGNSLTFVVKEDSLLQRQPSLLFWIVIVLLFLSCLIMFWRGRKGESISERHVEHQSWAYHLRSALLLSFDALIFGFILRLMGIPLNWWNLLIIFAVCVLTSFVGAKIGYHYGIEKASLLHYIAGGMLILAAILVYIALNMM
jgi:hypothetical protein